MRLCTWGLFAKTNGRNWATRSRAPNVRRQFFEIAPKKSGIVFCPWRRRSRISLRSIRATLAGVGRVSAIRVQACVQARRSGLDIIGLLL
jgi:hypothetical protein